METGNPDVALQPRTLHGVDLSPRPNPNMLILDGQQRLTALIQALVNQSVVDTFDDKNKPIKVWYYFDIEKAVNNGSEIEDAIRVFPENKVITRDFGRITELSCTSDIEEYENLMFPINKSYQYLDWYDGYMEYWDTDKDKKVIFREFRKRILEPLLTYSIPLIVMLKDNPKDAICCVFEKVNTGGVPLDVFDLLTATFAINNFSLRNDWKRINNQFRELKSIYGINSSAFLQIITLFTTYERRKREIANMVPEDSLSAISCKRKDLLKLELSDYTQWKELAVESLKKCAIILHQMKIFRYTDLPYSTILVPMSVVLGILGDEAELAGNKNKILRWFWNIVFGELYRSTTETRFAKDVKEIVDWVHGGDEPTSVKEATFAEERLYNLRTRNSAAYKGLLILLMQKGAYDLRTGNPMEITDYFDGAIDVHHIFPKKWCVTNQKDPKVFNSIINKTMLTSKTNRQIQDKAPSVYISNIERTSMIEQANMISALSTHLIDGNGFFRDDFELFISERANSLVTLVEDVTGKTVQRFQENGNLVLDDMTEDDEG